MYDLEKGAEGLNWPNTNSVSASRASQLQVHRIGLSVCLFLPLYQFVCVLCMCTKKVVLEVHSRHYLFKQSTGRSLASLSHSHLCTSVSLSLFLALSRSLSLLTALSLPICQLYVVEMLGVPGEPSLVPAIQTATLHLSTVPGLLKSATGKARHTHVFSLLNGERQSVRRQRSTSQYFSAFTDSQWFP